MSRRKAGEVAKLFPAGRIIKSAINRRFAAMAGHTIDGNKLFQVLMNLGDTDPQAFIEWLDRNESYRILGYHGCYANFPEAARKCAAFEKKRREKTVPMPTAQAATPLTVTTG